MYLKVIVMQIEYSLAHVTQRNSLSLILWPEVIEQTYELTAAAVHWFKLILEWFLAVYWPISIKTRTK